MIYSTSPGEIEEKNQPLRFSNSKFKLLPKLDQSTPSFSKYSFTSLNNSGFMLELLMKCVEPSLCLTGIG